MEYFPLLHIILRRRERKLPVDIQPGLMTYLPYFIKGAKLQEKIKLKGRIHHSMCLDIERELMVSIDIGKKL